VAHRDRRVAIDVRLVWCDAIAFEHLLDLAAIAGGIEAHMRLFERALALYRGDFLGSEESAPWMVAARERLRTRFVQASAARGAWLSAAGRWQEARSCYERALRIDEAAEDLCLGLMTCLAALRQPVEGVVAYRRFERCLAAAQGATPASATRALYRRLLAANL
jgi:two-component SAPR family response regulator